MNPSLAFVVGIFTGTGVGLIIFSLLASSRFAEMEARIAALQEYIKSLLERGYDAEI